MKTVTLNCASCGAPVFIPDEAETFICPSCQTTLMVDRGEGYITLKVLEKLSDSIQEVGHATSSAIRESAYVTQVELKRMQLQHLVSLEEIKLNSLQSELRIAKRQAPSNVITVDMEEIILQDNELRMHIRNLKKEIAQLDPGWEESLDVFQVDIALLNQMISILQPYSTTNKISNRLSVIDNERNKVTTASDQLETRLLLRDYESLRFPPFEQLSLDQMEQLQELIPDDLSRLEADKKSDVRAKFIRELNETLTKIKAVYPRMKMEGLVGPLVSLDYKKPYPRKTEDIQSMAGQVIADLEKVSSAPESLIRTQINQNLLSLLAELNNISPKKPKANKPRKPMKRWLVILLFAILGLALIGLLFLIGNFLYYEGYIYDIPSRPADAKCLIWDEKGENGSVFNRSEFYTTGYGEDFRSLTDPSGLFFTNGAVTVNNEGDSLMTFLERIDQPSSGDMHFT